MVHRRDLNGQVLVFGNQGALWGNAMTWWDHDTGTVWSQPLGEAIVGERKGARLELMAVQLSSWKTWREKHPQTLALDAPARNPGFRLESMSIVVDFQTETGVYAVSELSSQGPANDTVAGVPIAVVLDPEVEDRWAVFSRWVGDRVLTLQREGDRIVDWETGTVWDVATGRALEGPLQGEILGILPSFTAFESDARTFWPDARYWGE